MGGLILFIKVHWSARSGSGRKSSGAFGCISFGIDSYQCQTELRNGLAEPTGVGFATSLECVDIFGHILYVNDPHQFRIRIRNGEGATLKFYSASLGDYLAAHNIKLTAHFAAFFEALLWQGCATITSGDKKKVLTEIPTQSRCRVRFSSVLQEFLSPQLATRSQQEYRKWSAHPGVMRFDENY